MGFRILIFDILFLLGHLRFGQSALSGIVLFCVCSVQSHYARKPYSSRSYSGRIRRQKKKTSFPDPFLHARMSTIIISSSAGVTDIHPAAAGG